MLGVARSALVFFVLAVAIGCTKEQKPMTPTRQEQVFAYIKSQSQAHDGRGPSLIDIMEHFKPADEKDRLVLSDEIKGLEKEGRIKKDDSKMRNWIDHENIYFKATE
jgi:hypothetical protein